MSEVQYFRMIERRWKFTSNKSNAVVDGGTCKYLSMLLKCEALQKLA